MRGLQRRSHARQAWSLGNGLEAGCIGIGRVARHIIHEVALGACLTRQPEALLSTADLRRLRAARHCPYHRGDDEPNRGCHSETIAQV
jgi:hypothetical protein